MMDEVLALSAVDQSTLLRKGDLSCEALTRACLDRIAAHNPRLGAFVHIAPDRALRDARRLDDARRDARGPLWGVPTGLKDMHLTAGHPARMGSRAWRWLWSPIDDLTSAAVRRAGMVIIGKLATSELAFLPIVETDIGPPARNPWDPDRTAGGSSGGSAAAVAGGLLPIAPGSDGGGSIRIPAAFCGLVGHKPTRDLVPNPHSRVETIGVSVIGPIARSAPDAAALLDTLLSTERFLPAVHRPPGRLRVRSMTDSSLVQPEPAALAAVDLALRHLADLGHEVEPGPPLLGSLDEFLPIYQHLAGRAPVLLERYLQPATRWLRQSGRGVSRQTAMSARDALSAKVDAWFGDVDVWVTPTVALRPPPVGSLSSPDGERHFLNAAPIGAYTAALNTSGHPATSVPVWVDGQPMGVQLIGRRHDDARLLALAHTLLQSLRTPVVPTAPRLDS